MPSLSTVTANKVLDHLHGKTAFTMPSLWAALVTVTPTAGMTGSTITEISYTGYARKSLAGSDFNAASAGAATNATLWAWGAMTAGAGGTAVAVVLCDASTAGNVLQFSSAISLAISAGITPQVAAGAASFSLS